MMEDVEFTNIEISEVIEDPEQYADTDNLETENIGEIDSFVENSELNNDAIAQSSSREKRKPAHKCENSKSSRLPLSKIKHLMKMDPDVNLVTTDAVFLVSKATELFLETIAKETYIYTAAKKKKTMVKKDLDHVINVVDSLCFLEGAMDF